MKTLRRIATATLFAALLSGCKAFETLTRSKKDAQGKPYELIVVCPQSEWIGAVGDSLRTILTAPVPYLNQTEPMFDVVRVTEGAYKGLIADHRNILRVVVDPSVPEAAAGVEYDVSSTPQLVLTLQGPDDRSIVEYLDKNREALVQAFEQAERDRSIRNNSEFFNSAIRSAIRERFGVDMKVPKGYFLAKSEPDFIWARYEYPTASQGFFVYSYPYEGPDALTAESLVAARNRFARQIPGPSDGSYMTTSDAFVPSYRMFRLEGRLWCELRGFWDVAGDFMGGPFVSYTTVDTENNRVFTIDGYVYAPDLNKPRKRNYIRGIEHLLYTVSFPASGGAAAQSPSGDGK